jgi:hypothetical protein
MLHAGLDLSRKKLDICLLSESGEHVDQLAVPPDADALRALARRIDEVYRVPVCAVIESMTGARLVHDTLEQEGWDVEIADAQKVKGLAPVACKTDKIDSQVLALLSQCDLVPADLAARPPDPRRARAGPLSPAPGQAQVGAQEPGPLDPDQLRKALSGHRPVWSRGPRAACPTPSSGALARQHHGERGADRRLRRPDRADQPQAARGPCRPPLHPAADERTGDRLGAGLHDRRRDRPDRAVRVSREAGRLHRSLPPRLISQETRIAAGR